jgi:hypothetical protein
MNGYATLTADEHEDTAEMWAVQADVYRRLDPNCPACNTPEHRRMMLRKCQNLAVMHMEDAQRIRTPA